jgi:hypothetical protein
MHAEIVNVVVAAAEVVVVAAVAAAEAPTTVMHARTAALRSRPMRAATMSIAQKADRKRRANRTNPDARLNTAWI